MKKGIIRVATIQLVLLTFFLFVLSETQPIELSQTHQLTMTVEKIDYRRDFNESDLYIYDSSHEYRISKSALSPAYRGVWDLSKELHVGDTLTILYTEDFGIFGKYNLIIDAYSNDEIYLSYQRFNNDKHIVRTIMLIFFCVVELMLIIISSLILKLHKNTYTKKHRK